MRSHSVLKIGFICMLLSVLTFSCEEEEPIVTPVSKGYLIVNKITVNPEQSLFAMIEVSFKYRLNEELTIEGNLFRPVFGEIKLYNNNEELSGESTMSASGVLNFYPNKLLPEKSSLRVVVVTNWEIKKDNAWVAVDADPETTEKIFSTASYESPTVIVSAVSPVNQSTSQSLFTNPTLNFSQKIGELFLVGSLKLKVIMDEAGVKQNNKIHESELKWNTENNVLTITPKTLLTPLKEYEVYFKFHWEYETTDNVWKPYLNGEEIVSETKTFTFTTKEEISGSNTILSENIKNAYPIPYQYHFLKFESPKGFINLNSSKQNDLFQESYQLKVRFSSPGLTSIEVPLTFDALANKLTHSIPFDLLNEKIYKLQYLRIPIGGSPNDEEEIYVSYFRTSKFDTFTEKIGAMSFQPAVKIYPIPGPNMYYLGARLTADEYFDAFETDYKTTNLYGVNYSVHTNLIILEAILDGNSWFENFIRPLLFSSWDDPSFKPTLQRDTTLIPIKAYNAINLALFGSGSLTKLTIQNVESNTASPITGTNGDYISYKIGAVFQSDFNVIQNQVVNKYVGTSNPSKKVRFYFGRNSNYLSLKQGTYNYKMKYKLPDGTITSSVTLSIENLDPDGSSITRWDEGL